MDPLYENHDVENTRPEIRVVPRCISWNFPERGLWGRPAVGPLRNPTNWWLLGMNWLVIPIDREGSGGCLS